MDILENDKDYHDEQNVWLHLFEITAILIGGYCPRRFEQCGLFVSRILNDFHLPQLFSHFDNCFLLALTKPCLGKVALTKKKKKKKMMGGGVFKFYFLQFHNTDLLPWYELKISELLD